MKIPTIKDQQITLRPFITGDVDALIRAWQDPTISAYFGRKPTQENALAWIKECNSHAEEDRHLHWAIVENETGDFVGMGAFHHLDSRQGRTVASAWILKDKRGQGFAPASLRLGAKHLFEHMPVGRIQARCDLDNVSSYCSLTKAGMTCEGISRGASAVNGDMNKRVDQYLFSLLAEDLNNPPKLYRQPTLVGENIILRPYDKTDVADLLQAWQDKDIRKRNSVPLTANEEEAYKWIVARQMDAVRGLHFSWAIIEKTSGDFVGHRALKNFNFKYGTAGTGAWVIPSKRGHGYAPASMQLAVKYIVEELGIGRIQAECDTDNASSYNSLVKAGMHCEGVARALRPHGDTRKDQYVFSLTAKDLK